MKTKTEDSSPQKKPLTRETLLAEFETIASANRLVWLVLDFPDKNKVVTVDGTHPNYKAGIAKWSGCGAQVAGYVAVRESDKLEDASLPGHEEAVGAAFAVLVGDAPFCMSVGGSFAFCVSFGGAVHIYDCGADGP